MTNIANAVEQEYNNKLNDLNIQVSSTSKKSRLKSAMKWSAASGALCLVVAAAYKIFPETFGLENTINSINTWEYVGASAKVMAEAGLATGLVMYNRDKIDKLTYFIIYKPIELMGNGIDYISNKISTK